jgi:putative glycosyltransferase (TIGR04372 family)
MRTVEWPVIIRKTRRMIGPTARAIIAWIQAFALLPLVVFIVAARPFILIRLGVIDASRIGHLCNTEGYLCLRDVERRKRRIFDLIGCSSAVSNQQLRLMFARTFRIYPCAGLIGSLERACQLWTGGDIHRLTFPPTDLCFLENTDTHLQFTEDEHSRGRKLLERLGIPIGASWVCLHNRDSAYLDQVESGMDWKYHKYRDFDVQSMALCAEELASRGYYVLRMGSSTEQPLVSSNPKVIDYANHVERGDFSDIYLLGNCRFYLGSDSGIFAVSTIFKRPFAFVNFSGPQTIYSVYHWNSTPFTLKRAWHKEEGRMLSLRELFVAGVANATHTQTFETAGVELISNSREEIRDLAAEVDDRIKGVWRATQEDEELQQRFWEIVRQHVPTHPEGEIKARIGAAFLRKHVDLLN